jgi:hypothetical protein
MYFALGLLFIPFFLGVGGLSGTWAWSDVAFAVAAPLIYGIAGLLLGGVGSWLYNLIARWLGGVELTVSSDDASHSTERRPG